MLLPVISLFCGCGGFDLGFTQAGFQIILALDNDPVVIKSYNHNRKSNVAELTDLSTTSGAQVISLMRSKTELTPRGVIGGSPCQSFSKGNAYSKQDDAKHALPRKYAEILNDINSKYDLDFFVFENVHGITFEKHRETFDEFVALFENAGFNLFHGLLDAIDFGVPQYRPRVFVVGINKKYKGRSFQFPQPRNSTHATVADAIKGFPEPVFFHRNIDPDTIPFHPNHWTMQPKSSKFSNDFLKEGQNFGRSFRVLSWSKPSWSVAYGNREIHIHPSCKRRLSIYEAMQLQGFPSDYRLFGNLSSQVHQVCDAIPPQVASALGGSIYNFFSTIDASPHQTSLCKNNAEGEVLQEI